MTHEKSADAEQTAYALNSPVAALARMDAVAKSYFKINQDKHSETELDKISVALTSSIASDDDFEHKLRVQSHLIDSAFAALLLKTTHRDYFDEDLFETALRTHRQFRMSCALLHRVKNAAKQTERNGGNAGTHAE